ncbi:MAG: acyl-CoA dehydrogenase family protein [Anaerolineae bacterium]
MNDQSRLLRGLFSEFARDVVAPLADELDREERPPLEALDAARDLELLGLPFSEEVGGGGLGAFDQCLLLEEVGAACLATALTLAAHWACGVALERAASAEQKQRLLSPLAKGDSIGGYATPETGGSTLAAQGEGSDLIQVSGRHEFLVNGGIADLLVLFADDGGGDGRIAFVLRKASPGARIGPPQKKMGIRGADTREIVLEKVAVPPEGVLAGGDELALEVSRFLGVMVGAMCLGLAKAAYEASRQFAQTREQFGGPIARKGAVQAMIADMLVEIESLRALVYKAARELDSGDTRGRLPAVCKVMGSEVAGRVANRAVQLHGGSGYVRDFPIERLYRDARVARLFPASNELVRRGIALAALENGGYAAS